MEGKRSKEEEVEFFFFSGEKNEGENSKLSFFQSTFVTFLLFRGRRCCFAFSLRPRAQLKVSALVESTVALRQKERAEQTLAARSEQATPPPPTPIDKKKLDALFSSALALFLSFSRSRSRAHVCCASF